MAANRNWCTFFLVPTLSTCVSSERMKVTLFLFEILYGGRQTN